jgi:hypothetical protein
VWEREKVRQAAPEHPKAPLLINAAYISLCWVLDIIYNNRPIQRFWFLEVVARMPYFSYISMLHLYESLGWWRAGAELRRVRVCRSPSASPVRWNACHAPALPAIESQRNPFQALSAFGHQSCADPPGAPCNVSALAVRPRDGLLVDSAQPNLRRSILRRSGTSCTTCRSWSP